MTLVTRLRDALATNAHTRTLNISVSCVDGVVVLTGHCQTYYQKQMAGEVVMKAARHVPLENKVEVGKVLAAAC